MYLGDESPNNLLVEDARTRLCPFKITDTGRCAANACMAWLVTIDGYIHCSTNNITRNESGEEWAAGEPPVPDEGEGWESDGDAFPRSYHRSAKDKKPLATEQRWMRRTGPHRGTCGRLRSGW